MQVILTTACLILGITHEISPAPNCDLKAIFRTPKDFDEFEILERTNFETTPEKCDQDRLKEDPRCFANAQILLRIGSDKESGDKESGPYNSISKLDNVGQFISSVPTDSEVPLEIRHYDHNSQHYGRLEALCTQLLPLITQVLSKAANRNEISKSREKNDTEKGVYNTLKALKQLQQSNNLDSGKQSVNTDQDNSSSSNKNKLDGANTSDIFITEVDKNLTKSQEEEDHDSNIQKIAHPNDQDQINLTPIIEQGQNGKYISLNAIKLQPKERENPICGIEQQAEVPVSSENDSGKILKVSVEEKKLDSKLELIKLLNASLIPFPCLNCDQKIKNLVSYPIIHKPSEDHHDTGPKKSRFSLDLDNLNAFNGKPLPQPSSIINYLVPKIFKQMMDMKVPTRLVSLISRPKPLYISCQDQSGVAEVPHVTSEIHPEYIHRMSQCYPRLIKSTSAYEHPTVTIVESPPRPQEIRAVPTYLSAQFSKPIPVHSEGCEEINTSNEILVPIAVISNDLPHKIEVTARCPYCSAYTRELNE